MNIEEQNIIVKKRSNSFLKLKVTNLLKLLTKYLWKS